MPDQPAALDSERPQPPRRRGALTVALGIGTSRIFGFARDRVVAHYFGLGPHADVFRVALRGPNLLQNLLGEGTISASFIPVYTRLLAAGRTEDAGRLAGAVFAVLLAIAGGLAVLGFVAAEPIVAVFAAGFLEDAKTGAAVDRFALAVRAVRYLFPMTGILVLSAWALGILNSHRRFFLPYAAPALWNSAILAALIWAGRGGGAAGRDHLLFAACAGALVGGALQFLVQVPPVLRLLGGLRIGRPSAAPGFAETARAFGPALLGRGALQLGGYLDTIFASFLLPGALAAMGNAQQLYLLPVALLSGSVAVAALPELASEAGDRSVVALRAERELRRMLFLNLPVAIAYLTLGEWIVAAVYRTGSFGSGEVRLVYLVLAAYSLGLVASSFSRLLQNLSFALGDTATPARVATQRVVLAAALGVPAMLVLDQVALGTPAAGGGELRLGALGLALASGLAAWFDLWWIWRRVGRQVPDLRLPWSGAWRVLLAALGGALPAAGVARVLPPLHPIVTAAILLAICGAGFLACALALRIPELAMVRRLAGRRQS